MNMLAETAGNSPKAEGLARALQNARAINEAVSNLAKLASAIRDKIHGAPPPAPQADKPKKVPYGLLDKFDESQIGTFAILEGLRDDLNAIERAVEHD